MLCHPTYPNFSYPNTWETMSSLNRVSAAMNSKCCALRFFICSYNKNEHTLNKNLRLKNNLIRAITIIKRLSVTYN